MHPFIRHPILSSITIGFTTGILIGIAGTTVAASVLGSGIFTDVPADAYYNAAVGELYERGVIKGYDADTFGPDDYVTRGQVAVMMKRMRDDLLGAGTMASARSSTASVSSSDSSIYANPRGSFQFTTATYSVREGNGDVALTITRSGGNTGEITVRYTITQGSAVKGNDFTGESGTIVFADKQLSKVITIPILDDSAVEQDETFTVTITDVGRAVIGSPATATVTIVDDDGASSASAGTSTSSAGSTAAVNLSLTANTYAVMENDGSLTVTIQRTGTTTGTVGISYATGGGTAAAGSDYTATNGTLTFGAGETTKSINIPINDNDSTLGNKTFIITLSTPTGGAVLGTQASATVSIVDDENDSISYGTGGLRFAKSNYTFDETERTALITVQRIGGARGTVTVNVATANLTAMSTLDYTALSTVLTFAPFETGKIIAVPIVEDAINEDDEIFTMTLSSVSAGAQLLSPSTTSITITD